jgi:Asp-tRNA(Asn)/Glu-tRNA(Gln) amidotransferase B subunit
VISGSSPSSSVSHSSSNYEAVIGLEVHVQLKTASKMFTRVAAGYGEPPNTLTDPVVLALPGALPVLNKAALDQIIKAGLILGCAIAPVCKWDRKNYFYPTRRRTTSSRNTTSPSASAVRSRSSCPARPATSWASTGKSR